MPKKKPCSEFDSEEECRTFKKMRLNSNNPLNSLNLEDSQTGPEKDKAINKVILSGSEDENDPELLPNMLHNLEEELERELEIKAVRNNLTAWNVKNMIKAVITDTEVMKMVDYSLQKTVEKPVYELKLTRAKTKELLGLEQNAIWNMPIPQKSSDFEALITQELPEDSSDEEYEPHEEPSDDESKISEAAFEEDGCELNTSVTTVASVDSVRDENIGQRTRSKLSLSETPLEAIEQAFVPPDITTDMYNTDCDNEDWLNFLKEFMQPLDSNQVENNDDENDPEYNVMIDEEREAADKEEMREDRAVKVTKKELNDLMAELFEYTEMLSSDEEDSGTKYGGLENKVLTQEIPQNEISSVTIEYEVIHEFSESQYLLLNQQLQQHVQLLLQSYLLSYAHPRLEKEYPMECEQHLLELKTLSNIRSNSYFNVINLDSSIKLINDWSEAISNQEKWNEIQKFILQELDKVETFKKSKVRYVPELHVELIQLCLNSDAFLYPLYLPPGGFITFEDTTNKFIPSEDQLIAIGLEEFSDFFQLNVETKSELLEIVSLINHHLVPAKREEIILSHIKNSLKKKSPNPIKEFFKTKKAPELQQFVTIYNKLQPLASYPIEYFPLKWQAHLVRQ